MTLSKFSRVIPTCHEGGFGPWFELDWTGHPNHSIAARHGTYTHVNMPETGEGRAAAGFMCTGACKVQLSSLGALTRYNGFLVRYSPLRASGIPLLLIDATKAVRSLRLLPPVRDVVVCLGTP
ncbi:hypothetical protein TIFTF001_027372 [Ficus carica]|uniref:Uncharacterized protein n=1 Tax=Ficus carica TaxID=3494 RepID=A0AA88DN21_FICCA|nr:hypothetical protein TIFTF001_027372 [Ficus carica]